MLVFDTNILLTEGLILNGGSDNEHVLFTDLWYLSKIVDVELKVVTVDNISWL